MTLSRFLNKCNVWNRCNEGEKKEILTYVITKNLPKDVEFGLHQGFLRIQIQNSYDGKLEKDYGRLFTTKRTKEEHGIGLENVRKIVHKYNGIMEVCPDGDLFCVILLLYLTEDKN